MELTGSHFIGSSEVAPDAISFRGLDPRDGTTLEPGYGEASAEDVARAAELAAAAFPAYSTTSPEQRAAFLEAIGEEIMALGDTLLERCESETALPRARLEGERGRTVGQLGMFAALVREGSWVDARIDLAQPDRQPIPKPDIRRMLCALGPVAVFGASNFPLAFSVAGGDTASALAAGCPVLVKAHPAHPGTSELVGRAILAAAESSGMPEGVFSMIHGASVEVGQAMVTHPAITAVAFTGSLSGGRALFDAAARRPTPIPVFAEMGSSNPVFVLPGALAERSEAIADGLVGSVTLGAGQFCTNPGLTVLPHGREAEHFLNQVGERVASAGPCTVVHPGIKSSYEHRLADATAGQGVAVAARALGEGPHDATSAAAVLLRTDAETYAGNTALHEEIYGPATVAVTCTSREEMLDLARSLEGHLTATIQGTDSDLAEWADLVAILRDKAGRLLFNGFPTGVEVCASMQHGGPYPATTDSRSTSVGTAAIYRFARPVAYQDFPDSVLPTELQRSNPAGIRRLVDGALTTEAH